MSPNSSTEFIKFERDTTIDTIQYKKVMYSTDAFQEYWSIHGFIREDSVGRVFYRKNEIDSEKLMYDFGAHLGDTIHVSELYGYTNLVYREMTYYVCNIDSFLVGNLMQKRIHLCIDTSGNYDVEQWVETMGSMSGMLRNYDGMVGRDYFFLLCFTENDTLKYTHYQTNSTCYIISNNDLINSRQREITLAPNPVVNKSFIKINNKILQEQFILEIYNIKGSLIKREFICDDYEINNNEFKSGMYLFNILDITNQIIWSEKILIK
jgi:hypothetical protein